MSSPSLVAPELDSPPASPTPTTLQNSELEKHADSDDDDQWDRGSDAWCTLFGSWLAMISTFGYTNAFGVFQDVYGSSHTASASAISWIGSTQLFLLTSLGLFAGKLLDSGYLRQTLLFGSFLYVFSLFMLSIAHTDQYYQLFLSQGIGMGLGAGLIYIPSVAIQSHHWRRRRPMATGFIFTGSAIGGIIFPIMLNNLISRLGFGWGVRASAFLILVFLAFANFLMRPRPEALNAHSQSHSDPAKPNPKPKFRSFFTDVPYVLVMLGAFFLMAGMFYPYFYIQLYAGTHGVNTNVGFYTLAILNAASIPGRILPNMLMNTYGGFNVAIISALCNAIIIFALLGINTVAGIVVFAIISGFFSGAVLSSLTVVIASFARDHNEVGVRVGLAFVFGGAGALIGTPIDGALLGSDFTWWKSIIYSGITMILGILLLGISRHIVAKRKGEMFV